MELPLPKYTAFGLQVHAKVSSCKHVVASRAGRLAVPFASPQPVQDPAARVQFESLSHGVHRLRRSLHAGMKTKPLEAYHPDAERSRLRSPDFVQPHKNTSQVQLGTTQASKQFISTAKNMMRRPVPFASTNPGIQSAATKWIRQALEK